MKADLIQGVRKLTSACPRNWRQVVLLALIAWFTAPAIGQPIQLVSVRDPSQGPPAGGSGDSWTPIISPDGRYVLFASTANNLLAITNDTPIPARFPAPLNVFLRDRTNGTTTLVSVNLTVSAGGNADSIPVGLSTNGRYAVFESSASDLVAGDTNNATDVFVRDQVSGTTLLVSVSTNGQVGNGASRSPAMTPDGRYVAFVSAANNLVAGDTNRIPDVFVRDLQANVTALVSVGARSTNTTSVVGGSEAPDISADGRYVAFYSTATNLVPGVPAGGLARALSR
jgi:Tol biopolymer transport system component